VSSFSFTTAVHGKSQDYVVKSTNFESIRRIIINLNDRDRVINSREVPYDHKLSDEELMALVKRTHEERVESLRELFKISTKLEQKSELESNQKLGVVFLHNGLGKEALEEFKRALNLDEKNASVLCNLGLAYMQDENFAEAEKTFRGAIALRPNYPDLHNNLALALMRQARFDQAREEFDAAVTLHPGYAEAHFNMALCVLFQPTADGKLSEAVKGEVQMHLSQAVELNSYFNNEYYKVAQSYLAKDQLAEARQALIEAKTSVSSQTGSEIYHEFYLRLKYGDEGVDRRATERYIAKLEEILEKNPNYVDVHNDLGVAYLIQCRFLFNRSITEFKRALDINPQYAKAQKNLKLAENEGKGFLILLRAILYF
jgi:tetratricopeptide (TPR) repeat protein